MNVSNNRRLSQESLPREPDDSPERPFLAVKRRTLERCGASAESTGRSSLNDVNRPVAGLADRPVGVRIAVVDCTDCQVGS